MSAGRHNIEIEQGATWLLLLRYRSEPDAPVDLTGATARMQVRATYDAEVAIVSLTTENGRISIDGQAGEIALSIEAGATEELPAGLYVYDVEVVRGESVTRLLSGRAKVSPEVTR
ncbi:hypothetical protein [Thiohalocapsa marina]|uniref:hypothetical protein n=1 Tax=Thiohalocapsa marina TaxID=424902 RepID=UPI0036DD3626